MRVEHEMDWEEGERRNSYINEDSVCSAEVQESQLSVALWETFQIVQLTTRWGAVVPLVSLFMTYSPASGGWGGAAGWGGGSGAGGGGRGAAVPTWVLFWFFRHVLLVRLVRLVSVLKLHQVSHLRAVVAAVRLVWHVCRLKTQQDRSYWHGRYFFSLTEIILLGVSNCPLKHWIQRFEWECNFLTLVKWLVRPETKQEKKKFVSFFLLKINSTR